MADKQRYSQIRDSDVVILIILVIIYQFLWYQVDNFCDCIQNIRMSVLLVNLSFEWSTSIYYQIFKMTFMSSCGIIDKQLSSEMFNRDQVPLSHVGHATSNH